MSEGRIMWQNVNLKLTLISLLLTTSAFSLSALDFRPLLESPFWATYARNIEEQYIEGFAPRNSTINLNIQREGFISYESNRNVYQQRRIIGYGLNINKLLRRQMFLNNLVPWDAKELLPRGLVEYKDGRDAIYFPDYLVDVLRSHNRETLFQYESYWSDPNNFEMVEGSERSPYWYENISAHTFIKSLSQIHISAGYSFAIKSIERLNNGYLLNVVFPYSDNFYNNTPTSFPIDLGPYQPLDEFSIIIIPDGDYLDVYLDNLDHKLTSLVMIDDEFFKQFDSLIRTNQADLRNITWPQRGTARIMDLTLPQTLELFIASHTSTSTLTVYATENNYEEVIATLPTQAQVEVLTLAEDLANNPTMVQIRTEDGETGWAEPRHLQAIPLPSTSSAGIESAGKKTNTEKAAGSTSSDTLGLVPWLIGGGVGILALALLLVVLSSSRKKSLPRK